MYTLLELAIQHQFLKNHTSTFTEHYYDLKRIYNPAHAKYIPWLSNEKKRHWMSLSFVVLYPYLQLKLENRFRNVKEDIEVKHNNNISLYNKLLYWIYPLLHATENLWTLYYYIMYAISKCKYPSPIFHILRVELFTVHEDVEDKFR